MKDSDLRHLRRADLLALLEDLSRENDRLRAELADTKAKLEAKEVRLSECGSLAEAALQLSGVYEAADRAAETYLALVKQNYPDGDPYGVAANDVEDGGATTAVSASQQPAFEKPESQESRAVPSGNVYAAGGPVGRRQGTSESAGAEGGES